MKSLILASFISALIFIACGRQDQQASWQVYQPKSDELNNGVETQSVVEFHIPAGTGRGSWNTEATEVTVNIGQTLKIINDDSMVHRLHTGGRPCPHGPADMAGGGVGFYDCQITQPYNRATDGALYDHNVGTAAKFYLRVQAAPTPTPTAVPTVEPTATMEPTVVPVPTSTPEPGVTPDPTATAVP